MVTRKCALESSNKDKDKKIQELKDRITALERDISLKEEPKVKPVQKSPVLPPPKKTRPPDNKAKVREQAPKAISKDLPKAQPAAKPQEKPSPMKKSPAKAQNLAIKEESDYEEDYEEDALSDP